MAKEYKNIKTNVIYRWSDAHWEAIPNKSHYELVESELPKAVPKKKAKPKAKKQTKQ